MPGGRYLVRFTDFLISVLDLGYTTSASADCKLIASVVVDRSTYHDSDGYASSKVQASPDGMGLTIFTNISSWVCLYYIITGTQCIGRWLIRLFRSSCFVYEIYPESETPHITQIAHLDDLDPSNDPPVYLLPDTVVWCGINRDKDQTVFRVWDYRLNHSISFAFNVFREFDSDLVVCFIISKALKLSSDTFVGR